MRGIDVKERMRGEVSFFCRKLKGWNEREREAGGTAGRVMGKDFFKREVNMRRKGGKGQGESTSGFFLNAT